MQIRHSWVGLDIAAAEACRRQVVRQGNFYRWKAKFGGMNVSDARAPKSLERGNFRLKKLLSDAVLDNAVLKDPLAKS